MSERRRLPVTRDSVTHRFKIGDEKGYMTVGLYEDGTPGELFIAMAKEGSTISGLLDIIGLLTSVALQYGVPLEIICKKLIGTKFEPDGPTESTEIHFATSIPDYIFRWIDHRFCKVKEEEPAADSPAE